MKVISDVEMKDVSGGLAWFVVLGAALAVCKVAEIAYDIYQGWNSCSCSE